MKFLILSFLSATASAFVPTKSASTTTALSMSSESRELFKPNENKVPCFGEAPYIGFVGENYWDKLTMEYGSADTGTFLRAAELKHGRAAMIATVGYAFEQFGLTFDKISIHEYLSYSQNLKFADIAANGGPLQSITQIPALGWYQILTAIAAVEIYELTHDVSGSNTEKGIVFDPANAPILKSGGLTGDLGFNPLKIKITERRRLSELQNGRAAMFAISAWVAAEAVPGSVPLPLPW